MKRKKFSLAEKKLVRTVIVFFIIQLFIIFTFIYTLIGSQQISVNDAKQIDITVDDIYYHRNGFCWNYFCVCLDELQHIQTYHHKLFKLPIRIGMCLPVTFTKVNNKG